MRGIIVLSLALSALSAPLATPNAPSWLSKALDEREANGVGPRTDLTGTEAMQSGQPADTWNANFGIYNIEPVRPRQVHPRKDNGFGGGKTRSIGPDSDPVHPRQSPWDQGMPGGEANAIGPGLEPLRPRKDNGFSGGR